MNLKEFLIKNKELILKNCLSTQKEKIIKKTDDWYNEECWDVMYEETIFEIDRDIKL